jgi:nucleotide-binding universal stress UspA family protein
MSNATPASTPTGTIVVGVDGSEPSKDALRWAGRQAELTGADLLVIIAWHLPNTYGAILPDGLDFEGDARRSLEEVARDVLGPDPSVKVTLEVVEGGAAAALIEASDKADLLVVGSRGHGAFSGMLLGSVSEHCVSQANCPVVVLRHPHHHKP